MEKRRKRLSRSGRRPIHRIAELDDTDDGYQMGLQTADNIVHRSYKGPTIVESSSDSSDLEEAFPRVTKGPTYGNLQSRAESQRALAQDRSVRSNSNTLVGKSFKKKQPLKRSPSKGKVSSWNLVHTQAQGRSKDSRPRNGMLDFVSQGKVSTAGPSTFVSPGTKESSDSIQSDRKEVITISSDQDSDSDANIQKQDNKSVLSRWRQGVLANLDNHINRTFPSLSSSSDVGQSDSEPHSGAQRFSLSRTGWCATVRSSSGNGRNFQSYLKSSSGNESVSESYMTELQKEKTTSSIDTTTNSDSDHFVTIPAKTASCVTDWKKPLNSEKVVGKRQGASCSRFVNKYPVRSSDSYGQQKGLVISSDSDEPVERPVISSDNDEPVEQPVESIDSDEPVERPVVSSDDDEPVEQSVRNSDLDKHKHVICSVSDDEKKQPVIRSDSHEPEKQAVSCRDSDKRSKGHAMCSDSDNLDNREVISSDSNDLDNQLVTSSDSDVPRNATCKAVEGRANSEVGEREPSRLLNVDDCHTVTKSTSNDVHTEDKIDKCPVQYVSIPINNDDLFDDEDDDFIMSALDSLDVETADGLVQPTSCDEPRSHNHGPASDSAGHAPSHPMSASDTASHALSEPMPVSVSAGPVPNDLGPTSVSAGPIPSDHGPASVSAGPVPKVCGTVSVGTGSALYDRGPASVSTGPVPNDPGPTSVSTGPVPSDPGPASVSAGPVPNERGPASVRRGSASSLQLSKPGCIQEERKDHAPFNFVQIQLSSDDEHETKYFTTNNKLPEERFSVKETSGSQGPGQVELADTVTGSAEYEAPGVKGSQVQVSTGGGGSELTRIDPWTTDVKPADRIHKEVTFGRGPSRDLSSGDGSQENVSKVTPVAVLESFTEADDAIVLWDSDDDDEAFLCLSQAVVNIKEENDSDIDATELSEVDILNSFQHEFNVGEYYFESSEDLKKSCELEDEKDRSRPLQSDCRQDVVATASAAECRTRSENVQIDDTSAFVSKVNESSSSLKTPVTVSDPGPRNDAKVNESSSSLKTPVTVSDPGPRNDANKHICQDNKISTLADTMEEIAAGDSSDNESLRTQAHEENSYLPDRVDKQSSRTLSTSAVGVGLLPPTGPNVKDLVLPSEDETSEKFESDCYISDELATQLFDEPMELDECSQRSTECEAITATGQNIPSSCPANKTPKILKVGLPNKDLSSERISDVNEVHKSTSLVEQVSDHEVITLDSSTGSLEGEAGVVAPAVEKEVEENCQERTSVQTEDVQDEAGVVSRVTADFDTDMSDDQLSKYLSAIYCQTTPTKTPPCTNQQQSKKPVQSQEGEVPLLKRFSFKLTKALTTDDDSSETDRRSSFRKEMDPVNLLRQEKRKDVSKKVELSPGIRTYERKFKEKSNRRNSSGDSKSSSFSHRKVLKAKPSIKDSDLPQEPENTRSSTKYKPSTCAKPPVSHPRSLSDGMIAEKNSEFGKNRGTSTTRTSSDSFGTFPPIKAIYKSSKVESRSSTTSSYRKRQHVGSCEMEVQASKRLKAVKDKSRKGSSNGGEISLTQGISSARQKMIERSREAKKAKELARKAAEAEASHDKMKTSDGKADKVHKGRVAARKTSEGKSTGEPECKRRCGDDRTLSDSGKNAEPKPGGDGRLKEFRRQQNSKLDDGEKTLECRQQQGSKLKEDKTLKVSGQQQGSMEGDDGTLQESRPIISHNTISRPALPYCPQGPEVSRVGKEKEVSRVGKENKDVRVLPTAPAAAPFPRPKEISSFLASLKKGVNRVQPSVPEIKRSKVCLPVAKPSSSIVPGNLLTAPPCPANTSPARQITVDEFKTSVLYWPPVWLVEAENTPGVPTICKGAIKTGALSRGTLWPIPTYFESADEYVQILFTHLLHETWASVLADWKRNRRQYDHSLLLVKVLDKNKLFVNYCYQGLITKSSKQPVNEGDLVIIRPGTAADRDKKNKWTLALISKVTKSQPREFLDIHPKLGTVDEAKKKNQLVLNVFIQVSALKTQPSLIEEFKGFQVVSSLTSVFRQMSGLMAISRSPLIRDLLSPKNEVVFKQPKCQPDQDLLGPYNKSQAEAIQAVSKMMLQPYPSHQVALIQGPPGTGKSHTLVGIIKKVLSQKTADGIRPCLLMCAPSNAAVDEIFKRLLRGKSVMVNGHRRDINMVRVGPKNSMDPTAHPYSLDAKAEALWIEEKMIERLGAVPASVRKEYTDSKAQLQKLREEKHMAQLTQQFSKLKMIEDDIARLEKMINRIIGGGKTRMMMRPDRQKMEALAIARSDIVFCTLNTAGSNYLQAALSYGKNQAGHSTFTQRRIQFTAVIIDEACQSVEVEALIPLQYKCTKMILVGDPHQLPPTVISKEASEMNYSQSLFERLYNAFRSKGHQYAHMLDIQYRMHASIATFPSKFVYDERLQTDEKIAAERVRFPFQPYTVFDLTYGCEEAGAISSVSNREEAVFIVSLSQYLTHKVVKQENIGIITPYQQQRTLIMSYLEESRLAGITVRTVDGFQGQEKDVIIFSSVRAQSSSGRIGFLADRRRMNVALTRAKYACYIVAHLDSLKVDNNWKSLINDAAERKVIYKVMSRNRRDDVIRDGCRKGSR